VGSPPIYSLVTLIIMEDALENVYGRDEHHPAGVNLDVLEFNGSSLADSSFGGIHNLAW